MPNCGFGYLRNVRIRSANEIMNYFDFYSMQADSLHACVCISVFNSFLTKMLVRQVGHVTIDLKNIDKQLPKISALTVLPDGRTIICVVTSRMILVLRDSLKKSFFLRLHLYKLGNTCLYY